VITAPTASSTMINPPARLTALCSTFLHLPIVDDEAGPSLKPQFGQVLRSKRVRLLAATALLLASFTLLLSRNKTRFSFEHSGILTSSHNQSSASDSLTNKIDWSRFAYTQYATNSEYLCNSVMIFETLSRLGSKADRLLMYPSTMKADPESNNTESLLLLKAEREYGVKLRSIEVQHRNVGDRKNSLVHKH
jgi:hypothetical protein